MRDCLGRTRLWGFFPDEDDCAGGRHLYPPLPEGEGVLIKIKIPHGTAECHDSFDRQIGNIIESAVFLLDFNTERELDT